MRVIKVYKPCEQCKGTGLEWQLELFMEVVCQMNGGEGANKWACRTTIDIE